MDEQTFKDDGTLTTMMVMYDIIVFVVSIQDLSSQL